MKIAFLGDSITKGIPRVSFFNMLIEELGDCELTNLGKGGDTVSSLHRRIRNKKLDNYDEFVLLIGVNDVYSKINNTHKIMKTLRRQHWSKNVDEFRKDYQSLITFLNGFDRKYRVIAPLVFGEELTNKWNKELDEYENIIKDIISNYEHITYVDVRSKFKKKLSNVSVSTYLPVSLYETGKDVATLDTNEKADEMSKSRGLHLTLDGCHLNSSGASLVAQEIIKIYRK